MDNVEIPTKAITYQFLQPLLSGNFKCLYLRIIGFTSNALLRSIKQ